MTGGSTSPSARNCPRNGSTSDPDTRPPAFIVHSLAHVVAALTEAARANRPIVVASAPNAGIYAGAGWFGALVAAARAAVPQACFVAWLDCGDDAGAAQAAIRAGVEGIVFTGRADVAARLADIAAQAGIKLTTQPPAATLDLAGLFVADAETLRRRIADTLASCAGIC